MGDKPTETLRRVARYYLDKGYPTSSVKKYLGSFILKCDPRATLLKWDNCMDYAIRRAIKYPLVDIESIDITDREMDKIDTLDGKQAKRLAFTLLCLSKYWFIVSKNNDFWVNTKDSEIMRMANISTSVKRQSLLYWTLRENGMICFSKKVDNTNVKVCFVKDGKVVLHITDFRNLGYQYLRFQGEPYFECANCGAVSKIKNPGDVMKRKTGRNQKYCNACASKMRVQRITALSSTKEIVNSLV